MDKNAATFGLAGALAATLVALTVTMSTPSLQTPQQVLANICQGGSCMLCEGVLLSDSTQSAYDLSTCQPVQQPVSGGSKLGGKLQPMNAADRIAAIAAISAPDSVSFIQGDDAKAQSGCACAPWTADPNDPDPCMWTHPVPTGDPITEAAPRDMTFQAGEWSGSSCVPTMCREFNQLITLNGFRYGTPVACLPPGRDAGVVDGGRP